MLISGLMTQRKRKLFYILMLLLNRNILMSTYGQNVEKHVRDVCLQHGDVKVYTGCLYSSKKLNSIGIPGYFWKVIVYKNNNRTTKEAFLGKNKKSGSNNYLSIAVKLVNIKKRTGLHF